MTDPGYTYRAIVRSVYDGDTITVDVDLGMRIWLRGVPLRLRRINAPEVRGASRDDGIIARDWLRGQVDGKSVVIRTEKDPGDKYGRWLAEVYLDEANINDALVASGHAEYREY
jgi:micrococcal nuclease